MDNSLTERLCTRPFLCLAEKRWIAFQLLCAVKQLHHPSDKTSTVSACFYPICNVTASIKKMNREQAALACPLSVPTSRGVWHFISCSLFVTVISSRKTCYSRSGAGCYWSTRHPSNQAGCPRIIRASSPTFSIAPVDVPAIWRPNASWTPPQPHLRLQATTVSQLPNSSTSRAVLR